MKRHFQTKEMLAAKKKTTTGRKKSSSGGAGPRGGDPEAQHDEAMRILRAEYYGGVRDIVQELADRVKSEDISSQDDLETAIHQAVDGSYWVIYTHANFQVLMCSDHHDAYSEEFGRAPVEGDSINWPALAFAALDRDVRDQMSSEGVGVSLDEAPRRRSPHRRVSSARRRR